MGYEISEVHKCTAVECWLHPYRPGATKEAFEAEKQLVKGQKEQKDAKPVKQTLSLRE